MNRIVSWNMIGSKYINYVNIFFIKRRVENREVKAQSKTSTQIGR